MSKVSSILPELIEEFFNRLKTRSDKELTDSDYLELRSLFGEVLDKALHLLDRRTFTLYESQDNFEVILEISRRSGEALKLFPDLNYCPCNDFKINVIQHQSQYTCQHVLAMKLAIVLGKIQIQTLQNDQLNFVMQHLYS